MVNIPDIIPPVSVKSAEEAVEQITKIYDTHIAFLREEFQNFVNGNTPDARIRGFYPYAKVSTELARRVDTRLSYGFAPHPGVFSTTLTRPDIFETYYKQQFENLLKNHDVPIEIGVSGTPIPVHFALGEGFHLEGDLTDEQLKDLVDIFDVPDLDIMDDEIANATFVPKDGADEPLALFTGPRVALSLQRLKHY